MTEEELRFMAASLRNEERQTMPGMVAAMAAGAAEAAGPSGFQPVDTAGAEGRVKSMRDQAAALRGRGAPQGRTVGPSNIYVGPNWGESLAYGIDQGLAGYQSAKARKLSEETDAIRTGNLQGINEQERADAERTFGQGDLGLALTVRGQDIGASQFGVTSAMDQQRINNQSRQFGQKFTQDGSQFAQTLAQNQSQIDQLEYQFGVEQANKERGMALDESEVVPYLIDGKVVNTAKTMIEGKMVPIDPDTGQPIDIQGGLPLPKKSASGRVATPKYPKTFFRPDGTRQETIMIGGTRQNVGGEDDGKPFKRDGAREAISEEKLATELGKFEKRTEGTRTLGEKFNEANAVMEKFDVDIFGGETPFGFLEQVPGFTGGVIRTMNDLQSADPAAAEKFSAINDVIAQLVREQAGLSQTEKEIETISNTYGRNWYDRPDVIAQAWPRLQKLIASDVASKTAATHPQVLNEYRMGLKLQGAVDWTRIGVGLDSEMPPAWVPKPGSATGKVKANVDRRGRPKNNAPTQVEMQALNDEEEDLYRKFPDLRPTP